MTSLNFEVFLINHTECNLVAGEVNLNKSLLKPFSKQLSIACGTWPMLCTCIIVFAPSAQLRTSVEEDGVTNDKSDAASSEQSQKLLGWIPIRDLRIVKFSCIACQVENLE